MTEDPENSDLDTDDSEATSAELVARKAELEANLKAAVDDSVKAGFETQTASYLLRDLEWMSTTLGHDIETWENIAAAVEALPSNATMQQITLAQSKAIVASKQKVQSQVTGQLPVVRERVIATYETYNEKEQAVAKVKDALRDLNPARKFPKTPLAMSGMWLSGLFNKSFKG